MRTYILSTLALTFAALTITSAAYAQYKPMGDDGIYASPKLRQVLNARPVASAPVAIRAMACDKCADMPSAGLRQHAKAGEMMTGARQVTSSHGCASCETKLTTVGEGKAKHQVATHKCVMNVASTPGCCSSK